MSENGSQERQMMKQRRMVLGVLVCGLMTACARQEPVPEEGSAAKTQDIVLTEDAAETGDGAWQEAYMGYLADAPGREEASAGRYSLIYVDDDDIPELVDIGGCEAEGTRIVSFTEGKLQETQLYRRYFSYLEREGLFCNSDGNMDCYCDLVYQVQDGRVTKLAEGYYGIWQYYEEDKELEFDDEGMPVYLFEWNNEKVTEEEYTQALYEVYDLERAIPGYVYENGRDGYTADEMTKILEDWEG